MNNGKGLQITLTRRSVLKTGLAGAACLGISSSGVRAQQSGDPNRKMFEAAFSSGGRGATILERMKTLNVPGCSVVAIKNMQIDWAKGYGVLENGQSARVKPDSRFQAASLSKPITALGVLQLAEETQGMSIEDDVRDHLKWELKKRPCFMSNGVPTIDRLLSHQSGVIGRGSTFPLEACKFEDNNGLGGGYAGYGPKQTIPSLLQILDGFGNQPTVQISNHPGTFFYSGQGYMVLQKLIEDVSGKKFRGFMDDRILKPLQMAHSTFDTKLPQRWLKSRLVATGHQNNGQAIAGKRNTYPESAAAGLYTSALDLAEVIRWLNYRYVLARTGNGGGVFSTTGPLSHDSILKLMSGRGFFVSGTDISFLYSHTGANFGFNCGMVGFPNVGTGFVIMTNGNNGALVGEAFDAFQAVY